MCITYASSGQRDDYCTAIAGVLLKHAEWQEEDINDFVYKIAVAAKDEEAEKRKRKERDTHREREREIGRQNKGRKNDIHKNMYTHVDIYI